MKVLKFKETCDVELVNRLIREGWIVKSVKRVGAQIEFLIVDYEYESCPGSAPTPPRQESVTTI